MKPGKPPSWGPGAKSATGASLTESSCLWYTIAQGCITETFFPRPDLAHTRSMFLVVTGGGRFFSDERYDAAHVTNAPEAAVARFEVETHCRLDRYKMTKSILSDPFRDVLLERVRFDATSKNDMLRLWVFLAPAIKNHAYGNDGRLDPASGMLVASRDDFAIALGASSGFSQAGCWYQGPNDLWSLLNSGRTPKDLPAKAGDGNIILAGEIDCIGGAADIVLALGFAQSADEAISKASESLACDFESLLARYDEEWKRYRSTLRNLHGVLNSRSYESSILALKTHESKKPPGGMVASLGTPWGETEQQNLDFRYQLCWTRDAVQSAGAFLAIGDGESARHVWEFLASTQREDGHWPQNMWLDGAPIGAEYKWMKPGCPSCSPTSFAVITSSIRVAHGRSSGARRNT